MDVPKSKKKTIVYWEKQGNHTDSCRQHSLNAFFGGPRISSKTLQRYAAEFDQLYGTGGGSGTFTHIVKRKNDLTCLLAHIVESKKSFVTQTCVPGGAEFVPLDDDDGLDLVARFVWDQEHVWLEKLVDNRWWLIDSRSDGPRQIKGPRRDCNHGCVWIWKTVKEIPPIVQQPPKPPKPKKEHKQKFRAPKHQGDPDEL